ncbi:hypothetical protein ACIBEF_06375 [Micromonospora sp. NPDC050795]|uniref:hypothetical protein n=1 Tax=Micromonospora sp. NPDC050795 TaxID=3364282 RepID=UPI00378FDBFA
MSNDAERHIMVVHVPGIDGLCSGCRAWWSLLTPYPCWQVDWAASQQTRSMAAALLGGRA